MGFIPQVPVQLAPPIFGEHTSLLEHFAVPLACLEWCWGTCRVPRMYHRSSLTALQVRVSN